MLEPEFLAIELLIDELSTRLRKLTEGLDKLAHKLKEAMDNGHQSS